MSMRFVSYLLVVVVTGCGSTLDASVSGRVTLDDEPLPKGNVSFVPKASGPSAYGEIQSDGTYQLQVGTEFGIPPGDYKVVVISQALPPVGDDQAPSRLLTPMVYADVKTTPLKKTVEQGSNSIDLDLLPPTD